MTTYRLMDGLSSRPGSGPSSPTAYAGNFIAGLVFGVTQGGMWFDGYWWWVPPGGDTGAQKFALWSMIDGSHQALVAGSVVTSGTLTAGQWNFVALPDPIQISVSGTYVAATGWTSVNGFPVTNSQFASGQPYVDGITNGPVTAYSDGSSGGTHNSPFGGPQGRFSVAGADPSVTFPASGSNNANFWIDVQVSDTAPSDYTGSYRLWPNQANANADTFQDAAVNYVVATEFALSESCQLNNIWYYSPPGAAQLATRAAIWDASSGTTSTEVAVSSSPAWSGAAGSGWVSTPFSGVTLPAGDYKVSVFNDAATPDGWSAKDASTNYWDTGAGASGIINGPLSAPGLSGATLAWEYGGDGGSTPPYSNGTQEHGQSTFWQGPANGYPYLYVDGLAQNYWVDVEVTPLPEFTASAVSTALAGLSAVEASQLFTASAASTAALGVSSAAMSQFFTTDVASTAPLSSSAVQAAQAFMASLASAALPGKSAATMSSSGGSGPTSNHNPWFENVLTDTLTRQRASTGVDTYGNTVLDWTDPDELTLPVRVAPPIIKTRLGSHAADEDMQGRDAIRYDLEAWLATDDVTALDRCVFQGKTYEVTGEPGNRTDFDGNYMYSKILLREVAG